MARPVSYQTIAVDGFPIFYREAGDRNALVLLPLDGLPSSSLMYEPLLAQSDERANQTRRRKLGLSSMQQA